MSGSVDAAEYLDFLSKEYLAPYVSRGGAAVKLLVPADGTVAAALADGLSTLGDDFLPAAVDAAGIRVHMIDQLFAAVAQQVDWLALAGAVVRDAYHRADFPAPRAGGPDPATVDVRVATVAGHHDVDPAELYRDVRRRLERAVLDDPSLSHEFRVAMFRLCQWRLDRGDLTEPERDTVLSWLTGQRVGAAELRRLGLHTRVTRHNARSLLVSLSRWVRRAGHAGLVLRLDLERLATARRPPAGLRDGVYYSKAATLDTYEVLRQLIDGTDEFDGLFVAVLLPPELVTDEARGLPAYAALHLRVADEVRDRHRPNPYAALVRLRRREALP